MARVLKPQPRMSPIAEDYAATVMKLSKIVLNQSRTVPDIAYGSEEAQGLDLCLPESDSQDALPVLTSIHGGGWRNGYKEWNGIHGAGHHLSARDIRVGRVQASSGGQVSTARGGLQKRGQVGLRQYRRSMGETQTDSSWGGTRPEDTWRP